MIRLIHTGDWHLGATLQGWSRETEHRAALAQLVKLAKDWAVDAIVVAGDIFDSLNPSAEAQRLLYDTLRDLRGVCPHANIALIAGNHDPAGRLEAPRALFEIANVASVGVIARRDGVFELGAHLSAIRDKGGRVGAYLLAMPYPRPADLPLPSEELDGSPVIWGVRKLYSEAIEAARREIGAAPLVVTGHLHVAGAIESEGAERRILVGGEHAVPPDIFPADLAYVALGHLHKPQRVGRDTIRYAGALIPMSKSEIDYPHGATMVEIDQTGAATSEHFPFERSVAHLRLPARGALALNAIEPMLAALNLDPQCAIEARPFVHLTVGVEGPVVGLKAEIDAICEKYPLRRVSLSVDRPPADLSSLVAPPRRLAEHEPLDLFRAAFMQAHGVAPSDEHLRSFQHLAGEM